jgi:CPA2 family monovalent cation:H+ antiporter-2
MAEGTLLLEVGLLLAGLAVAGVLARALNQSVIPFYIVTGLLIGEPGLEVGGVALDLVTESGFVTVAAELGIVLLLFFLGLEFSFGKLVGGRDRILRAGTIDLAINLPLGLLIAFVFGFGFVEALFLAGIVYISSSAIITKSLIDLEWIANPESETILGVLVYEDLFIAFFLSLVSALALGSAGVLDTLGRMAAAVAVMAVLTLVAAYGSDQLARLLDVASDESAMLRALAVAVLGGGAALQFGLSEAVAAFFVGMAFGETDKVDELERLTEKKEGKEAEEARLAIELAETFTIHETELDDGDAAIIQLAEDLEGAIVVTNDKLLRARLRAKGIPNVHMRSKAFLSVEGFPGF